MKKEVTGLTAEQNKAMDIPEEYAYYPGCSLHGTAIEFEDSVQEVAQSLNIRLLELPDWNCCGASSAHMTDHNLAIELAARNLRLAEELGKDLLVPCAACFNRLKAAQNVMRETALAQGEEGPQITVYHMSEWLRKAEALQKIRDARHKSLNGLKLAPYYGCLISRPPAISGSSDPEDPKGIDHIIQVLGGEAVKWSFKTECCGGSLTMARADITIALVSRLVKAAVKAGARGLVTMCPMCQANLETRQMDLMNQDKEHPVLPVFYATELIAACLSEPKQVDRWKTHLIDPGGLLDHLAA